MQKTNLRGSRRYLSNRLLYIPARRRVGPHTKQSSLLRSRSQHPEPIHPRRNHRPLPNHFGPRSNPHSLAHQLTNPNHYHHRNRPRRFIALAPLHRRHRRHRPRGPRSPHPRSHSRPLLPSPPPPPPPPTPHSPPETRLYLCLRHRRSWNLRLRTPIRSRTRIPPQSLTTAREHGCEYPAYIC
ncbi:hypothetical protein EJ05DRAFT_23637 [Pseudovirgaria hyperparasitica]|uniref:Uncharacterized protein n=1 Tax=Pseudovirgaria hyperparasitica TaxID=470096 RepID=A0A6A6WLI0_9PEZI|nr:uncharacterized protein EJ05DRAFT_23637 [Pseudovirgaria hyperparasitica]KAF2763023.1 hypothetical protein EJ05DRAFT_23637 [Pseudovirgaria hyperparasitica]